MKTQLCAEWAVGPFVWWRFTSARRSKMKLHAIRHDYDALHGFGYLLFASAPPQLVRTARWSDGDVDLDVNPGSEWL